MDPDLYLWLRPGIQVLKDGTELILIEPGGEVIQISDPLSLGLHFVESLNGEQRASALSSNAYSSVMIPLLLQRSWLVTLCNPLEALLGRYSALSREISAFAHLYPLHLDRHFALLSTKKVLIVGLGGIGTNVAFALCANGVGSVTLVDMDVVELTNLNRQFLYTADDLGKSKVEIAALELGRRFPSTTLNAVHRDFDDPDLASRLVAGSDLVIVCGESAILHDYPELCDGVPIILSGYQGAMGVIGPLLNARQGTACWKCVMARYARPEMRHIQRSTRPRQDSWNPSGFGINALTGSICSNIAVGFLAEQPAAAQWLGLQLKASYANFTIAKSQVEPRSCEHSTVSFS